MEAYGTAFSLREAMAVKNDGVEGRAHMFEKVAEGDNAIEASPRRA
jgi:DNA-directed RNA polymerase beta subunit